MGQIFRARPYNGGKRRVRLTLEGEFDMATAQMFAEKLAEVGLPLGVMKLTGVAFPLAEAHELEPAA